MQDISNSQKHQILKYTHFALQLLKDPDPLKEDEAVEQMKEISSALSMQHEEIVKHAFAMLK